MWAYDSTLSQNGNAFTVKLSNSQETVITMSEEQTEDDAIAVAQTICDALNLFDSFKNDDLPTISEGLKTCITDLDTVLNSFSATQALVATGLQQMAAKISTLTSQRATLKAISDFVESKK